MSRALLVIDVQREYFDGALPISYPVGHLENILAVMDQATKSQLPTAVVRHHQADPEQPTRCQPVKTLRPLKIRHGEDE